MTESNLNIFYLLIFFKNYLICTHSQLVQVILRKMDLLLQLMNFFKHDLIVLTKLFILDIFPVDFLIEICELIFELSNFGRYLHFRVDLSSELNVVILNSCKFQIKSVNFIKINFICILKGSDFHVIISAFFLQDFDRFLSGS